MLHTQSERFWFFFVFFMAVLYGCTAPAVRREPPLQVRQDVGPDAVGDDYCWQMLLQPEKPGECWR